MTRRIVLLILVVWAMFTAATAQTAIIQDPSSLHTCGEVTDSGAPTQSLRVALASPTTLYVNMFDQVLQQENPYHPLKCLHSDTTTGQNSTVGRLLLLGQGCVLRNADTDACNRKMNFPYPVPPHSQMLKLELEVDSPTPPRKFQMANNPVAKQLNTTRSPWRTQSPNMTQPPGDLLLEVCAPVGPCAGIGVSARCRPSFTIVYDDQKNLALRQAVIPQQVPVPIPAGATADQLAEIEFENNAIRQANNEARQVYNIRKTPFFDAWAEHGGFVADVTDEWVQPMSTPAYGPYPHCPEVNGLAVPCTGEEGLLITFTHLELTSIAMPSLEDNAAMFQVKFNLAWDDRYATHPCTYNLALINTGGKQYKVPSSNHWLPQMKAANAKSAEEHLATSDGNKVGLSYGPGRPVNTKAEADMPWPKQLFLDSEYHMKFHPFVNIEWGKYPFDKQTLVLKITDPQIDMDMYRLEISTALKTDKLDIDSNWRLESTAARVMSEHGRNYVEIEVVVARRWEGKVKGVMLPAFVAGATDTVFHLRTDYEHSGPLFMTAAVLVGVGLQMITPAFLGIPQTLSILPFLQCFTLILLLAGIKQMPLILLRTFWTTRIHLLEKQIKQRADKAAAQKKLDKSDSKKRPAEADKNVEEVDKNVEEADKNVEDVDKNAEEADKDVDEEADTEAFAQEMKELRSATQHLAAEPPEEIIRAPEEVSSVDLAAKKQLLQRQLRTYDIIIKVSVPVFLIVSWSIVAIVYLA